MNSQDELDYSKIKFKSGLEIHQQLDSHKLFCDCPSLLRNDEPDFLVHRKLHVVAGESGEIDVAVQYQSNLEKEFVYQGYNSNNCLVDIDEEPPHKINEEALRIALQIALLLNCKIISASQIMRKTVINGSNTSGFQRTVLIARDGYVETISGRVRIDTICLEEDSAREIKKEGNKVYYNLDRLGIPLVEIATAPDIKNPRQAKEVALHIGDVLRSCKVKRGIGTIRQDVNISILNGNRVEMKGVQNMKTFIETVENEVLRQKKLHDSKKPTRAEVRNSLPDGTSEFLRPMPGADRMYPETDLPLLKISRNFINDIKKDLPKLRRDIEGELKDKLTPELVKLILGGHLEEFEVLLKIYPKDPPLIAKMLTVWRKELATKLKKDIGIVNEIISIDILENLLEKIKKGKLNKRDIKPIFSDIMNGISLEEAINIERADISEIEEKIMKLIKEKPELNSNAYMGLVMKEFKGKIDGKTAMEIIGKIIKRK